MRFGWPISPLRRERPLCVWPEPWFIPWLLRGPLTPSLGRLRLSVICEKRRGDTLWVLCAVLTIVYTRQIRARRVCRVYRRYIYIRLSIMRTATGGGQGQEEGQEVRRAPAGFAMPTRRVFYLAASGLGPSALAPPARSRVSRVVPSSGAVCHREECVSYSRNRRRASFKYSFDDVKTFVCSRFFNPLKRPLTARRFRRKSRKTVSDCFLCKWGAAAVH